MTTTNSCNWRTMVDVIRYTPERAGEWNDFVARSKNGTFIFDRRYMDYHADRFTDHSLMIFRQGRLFALLPANVQGTTLYTHQGLTYGGLVTDCRAVTATVCEAFDALNDSLRQTAIRRVVYKSVPWIYHQLPAEEDAYALFLKCKARLVGRDVSATVSQCQRLRFEESRRSGLRKARRAGLTVRESQEVALFWDILADNLARKYQAQPVHTVNEMELLMTRFPDNIRLFMVYDDRQQPIGGTVLYCTPQVVHTQYISASVQGKSLGALDLLFDELLNSGRFAQSFFDFGTSMRPGSSKLNEPLIFQKEGFGARAVCYDTYEWTIQ